MTGFPSAVRSMAIERANGLCEKCGERRGVQLHHRRPRGMGSTRRYATNAASNALFLCYPCHLDIESNRDLAYENGWLVHQCDEPRWTPVLYRGMWVHLDDHGNLLDAEAA